MTKYGPDRTPGWTVVGGWSEGQAVPDLPEDLWGLEWRTSGQSIRVTDPLYGNLRQLAVVEIDTGGGPVVFAVREVSNGIFLFALPAAH